MGSFADIVNSAVGAVSNNRNGGGTTLDDFLNHFSDRSGAWINTIDPYNTFDLYFKFHPDANDAALTDGGKKQKQSALEKLGSALVSSAKSAVKNLANNLTGGLLGSIMNSKVKITSARDQFFYKGEETFLEYLAAANLLVGKEDWIGESAGQVVRPLELSLGLYCQNITIPSIVLKSDSTSTYYGDFPVVGHIVEPDSHDIQMSILNTKVPILERIIYPWMREVTYQYWSYQCQPYTTADITVDFTKHCDMKYIFYGCRPTRIYAPSAKQQNGDISREVTFTFDYMAVNSNLKVSDSAGSKLLSGGTTLINSAASMLNL